MTPRRGPKLPGSPDPKDVPAPRAGSNPDGKTPAELPSDTREKAKKARR